MTRTRPQFSLVSVVGDAAGVLPAYIDSIEAQGYDLGKVQVVLVEVDAPDDVVAMLRYWASERPELVTLLSAPEDGPVAALNAGLAAARGTWVGFPEVEDALAPDYLAVVAKFLTRNPSTALVATNRLLWDPATDQLARQHPLRGLFQGNHLVDLTASTWHFHNSAAAAFFPLDPIHDAGLEFDTGVPRSFAGGHFLARYLIEVGHPAVGFLRRARYHVRRQASGAEGTAARRQFGDARALFERGYTDLVRRARAQLNEVPDWLQRMLAFELTRFLDRAEGALPRDLAPGDDVDAFHGRIAGLIKAADLAESIERAQFFVERTTRLALMHGYRPESWVDDHVLIDKHDDRQGLVRARYYFTGVAPPEQVINGGVRSAPVHAKTRTLTYLGRAPLCERILWVRPAPDLAISISGEPADLRFQRPSFVVTTFAPAALAWNFGAPPGRLAAEVEQHYLPAPRTQEGLRAQQAVDHPKNVRDFADAWVFMDKIHAASDNGEHLFAYVCAEHPEINAFFVVEEGTGCWKRLRKTYGRRVVAHGSHEWRVLMAHCVEFLGSHADGAILTPRELTDFMRPQWRFTYLVHGIRKDDAARWLGSRPVDLVVATTKPEYDSMAGDGNDYPYTSKEIQLAGMPRLDRLLALDQETPAEERGVLLVAPTWRDWLVPALAGGSQRRGVADGALESEFVTRWLELLGDPGLANLCEQHGLTLTLLAHPNLEALLPRLALPAGLEVATYAEDDAQSLFARSRVVVTDFSSIAFDAAYISRPVVYFQFDRARMEAGTGSLQPGYYSYQRDGFGPVTTTVTSAVAAIGSAVRSGPGPAAPYAARIAATFPLRDGRNCERVVAAVRRGPAGDAPPDPRPSRERANQEE